MAIAWLDKNANGIKDKDEPPFPDVCIWFADSSESMIQDYSDRCQSSDLPVTDNQGTWGKFLPGGSCEDIYIFSIAPEGYQPTTDTASNGCSAQFGFVENGVEVSRKILNNKDFTQRQITILWAKRIGIWVFILAVAGIGTFWLEKKV